MQGAGEQKPMNEDMGREGLLLDIKGERTSSARWKLIALIRLYQLCAYTSLQLVSWAIFSSCLALTILIASIISRWHGSLPDAFIIVIGILMLAQLGACIIIKVIPTMLKWISPLKAAEEIEHKFGCLNGRVTSGLSLALRKTVDEGISRRLIQAAIADALRAMLSVRWQLPLFERTRRAAISIAVSLALWCIALLQMKYLHLGLNELLLPFLGAYGSLSFSKRGKLAIEPLPKVVLRGSNLNLRVRAICGVPKDVWLKVADNKGMPITEIKMHPKSQPRCPLTLNYVSWRRWLATPRLYETSLRNLNRDVIVMAQSGNVRSRRLLVRVTDLPSVEFVKVSFEPPSYTGLEPREVSVTKETALFIPFGSLVTITVGCNNELDNAVVIFGDGSQARMSVHGKTASVPFEMRRDARIILALQDAYGLKKQWGTLRLLAQSDKSPTVAILNPKESELRVLSIAVVPIVVRASDDYGLRKLKVTFVGNAPRREIELGNYDGEREATANLLMQIVGLRIGSIIRFQAVAYDNDELLGPKIGYSRWCTVRIVTLAEFLSEFDRLERKAESFLGNAAAQYRSIILEIERLMKALEHRYLSRDDLDRLRDAWRGLRYIKNELERLADEFRSKVDMAHLNQIASPIDWLEQSLRQFIYQKLDGDIMALLRLESAARNGMATEQLREMARSASSDAKATLESLNRTVQAIERIRRFSKLLGFSIEAMKLSASLHELGGEVGHIASAGLPKRSALFKKLIGIGEHIWQFEGKLKELVKEWSSAREDDVAKVLGVALENLPVDELKAASTALEKALRSGGEAKIETSIPFFFDTAQKFCSSVLDAYERARFQAYRSDRDKLARLWRQVEKLTNEQRELTFMTKRLLGANEIDRKTQKGEFGEDDKASYERSARKVTPTVEYVLRRQRDLIAAAQTLPSGFAELTRFIPQLDAGAAQGAERAIKAMEEALKSLGNQESNSAIKAQTKAVAELEALLIPLSNALHYSYGVASQLVGIAQMEMLDLACLQEQVNLRSERDPSSLMRRSGMQKLIAAQELMIRSALKRADCLFGVPWSADLRELVRAAQTDASDVARAIESGSIDAGVLQKQRRILAALLRLANELSGMPKAMEMMQKLASQREGAGMQGEGRKKEEGRRSGGDWQDWLQSLPSNLFGRFIEHGPPMRSVPEVLTLPQPQASRAEAQGYIGVTKQPARHLPDSILSVPYRNAIMIYFKRMDKR